jgi:hypothetical protein
MGVARLLPRAGQLSSACPPACRCDDYLDPATYIRPAREVLLAEELRWAQEQRVYARSPSKRVPDGTAENGWRSRVSMVLDAWAFLQMLRSKFKKTKSDSSGELCWVPIVPPLARAE